MSVSYRGRRATRAGLTTASAALALVGLMTVAPPSLRPAAATSPSINDLFVIGVDDQPTSSFATWKNRGINTMVRIPDNDFDGWDNALVANGLYGIRKPRTPAADDYGRSYLLASANFDDEPETGYCTYASGRDAQFATQAAADPSGLPFFTNYAGKWILLDLTPPTCTTNPPSSDNCGIRYHDPMQYCYGEYFRATDWISFDVYPRNWSLSIDSLSTVLTRIAGTPSYAKPQLAYVEASDFDCTGAYPNQWHMVYEAVEAVIGGARGIVYFPHGFGDAYGHGQGVCGNTQTDNDHDGVIDFASPDHTTVAIQNEMTRLNTALARVPGATMNGTVNPSGVTFESGTGSTYIKSGTRSDSQYAYYFTENDNASTAYTHTVRFWGVSNCSGKTVTVLDDTVTSSNPYTFADRTLTLDQFCQTTVPETWSAYRYHIYQVPIA